MQKGRSHVSRRLFLGACAGFGLSSCASSGPSVLYGLEAGRVEAAPRARKRAQVLVPRPRALKALDTENIAVVEKGLAYSYFPESAWTDSLPNVIQAKLVQTLQNTNRLRGVGLPGDGLLIDYQLQTDLRSFELRIDGPARAVVEIAAKLVNDRNGRTLDNRVFRAEVMSGGVSVDQAVTALNSAADKVFQDIARWILSRV